MTDADRIAQLEEEVAYLRRELGDMVDATRTEQLRRAFRLEPMQARLLLRLYLAGGRVVSYGHLADLLAEDATANTLRVHVYRLGKRLGLKATLCAPSTGYALTPAAQALTADVLADQRSAAA